MSLKVVSFGGGVNSTAMLIGIAANHPELTPNLILFADTGGEKPETYQHVVEFSAWLVEHGLPEIITVREERFTLEQGCLTAHSLPSIVVGLRSCSDKFKIQPPTRFLRKWQPAIDLWAAKGKVVKLIGFDAGEAHRIKQFASTLYDNRYPLVEWQWGRDECIAAIEGAGLSAPPKSSCFFCPEMRESEILQLQRDNPALFQRAIAMEENNTRIYSVAGLARKYSWKQIADYHAKQLPIFMDKADRLPCVCFDGEA